MGNCSRYNCGIISEQKASQCCHNRKEYKITKIDEETFDEVAGDADTLAGLLLELKGEFPVLHEKVVYDCYEFEVLEMDNRRILKVKFTVNEPAGEGSETEK